MVAGDREDCVRRLSDRFDLADEFQRDFDFYVDRLVHWQKVQNLVSRETLANVWSRHILDSAALLDIDTKDGVWMDLGSGAGFPGLVSAILKKHRGQEKSIILVESNARKVSFLRMIARELKLPVKVHNSRVEKLDPMLWNEVNYISARAFAPLSKLFEYCFPALGHGAIGYFHKGRDIDVEIKDAANTWLFDLVKCKNSLLPESEGVVIEVKALEKIR